MDVATVSQMRHKKDTDLTETELQDIMVATEEGYSIGLPKYAYALRRVVDGIVLDDWKANVSPQKTMVKLMRLFVMQVLTMMYSKYR